MTEDILKKFHPLVEAWFTKTFGELSPPQKLGWPSISEGNNTLLVAPTGSGKTLAAFLWCINHLVEENIARPPLGFAVSPLRRGGEVRTKVGTEGVRVLYVSPLKALNNDIHRNLEIPLKGILAEAKDKKIDLPPIRSAVRTGDTTQTERARMLKHPPDILITTPESLYLMLSSEKARKMFHTVRYVIIDEIHSISSNKRGVHLSITLERLEKLVASARGDNEKTFVRIGLSATQRPLETIAEFLGGFQWEKKKLVARPVQIIDAGYKKNVDLQVVCAAHDFSDMPMDSIWPLIFPQLLDAIIKHKTTLIFVNNRRLAERVSAKLNEMIEGTSDTFNNYAVPVSKQTQTDEKSTNIDNQFKIFAYHGSMSRTVRERLESDLKSGKLRALVTTSALELGIDIGSVDLVIQIQSPKGIARGLQRVGRSGHLVRAQSKGRLFVTHRDDLLETTVVAKAMTEHDIEKTFVPKNCLDVLAQQIVAMVSVEEWNVDDLFDLLRQSSCYHLLTEKIYHNVLQMLGGRYTNETFRELRARLIWDKIHNTLAPLPGSSRLAIMNAGTIPDRGYFGVYLEDLKTKVGEVDEEFIYESRSGDTFILGSNVWRMIDIDANKVVVQSAPGQPARMPFWRGESIGRTYELGVKIGEFLEKISGGHEEFSTGEKNETQTAVISNANEFLKPYPIDAHAARNLVSYVEEQRESTQLVPTHRTLVVEGFRDEVGDPRIVVHSCYGKGVNGLLGIVLLNQLQQRLGTEVQMLYNDSGILFRCSDVERLPLDILSNIDTHAAQKIILENIPSSPLFGALFRQNAERALLLPKGNPGTRRPFFLQRLKSADLLQIVRQYTDFPIVIETIRECLNDVLDFEHFKEIIEKIESKEIQVHTVQTETPSPFATSLLFDFAAVYMYEWDDPKNAGQQQFAMLNRELVGEVVKLDEIKSVVRHDAVAKIEEHLQFTGTTRRARSAEELMEVFLRLGELTKDELAARTEQQSFIASLQQKNIITSIFIDGKEYLVATEELPLYLPFSRIDQTAFTFLPEHLQTTIFKRDESLRYVMLRMLRSRGPLTVKEISDRFGISEQECGELLSSFEKTENIVHGQLTQDSTVEQWCYRPNLDRIHRASISLFRKEITPATLADFTQLLAQWQHRHQSTMEEGNDGLQNIVDKMQGCVLPAEVWETEIFQTRLKHYDPALLRTLASRGDVVCVGASAGKTGWVSRGEGAFFVEPKEQSLALLSASAVHVFEFIHRHGASFLSDVREGMNISLTSLNHSLAELFWRGLITNDVVDELLNIKRYRSSDTVRGEGGLHLPEERIEIINPRRNPLSKVAMRSVRQALRQVTGWSGRWSLVHTKTVLGPSVSDDEKIVRQAQQLLLRYGIVAREIAKREENLLPWSLLAMELQRMEMRGEIRRGYFVEGLSGMQFALPEAVSMLDSVKAARNQKEQPVVINACDPANPYGSGIELNKNTAALQPRISRLASNYFVFENGIPLIWLENFGARIYFLAESNSEGVRDGLLQFINHIRSHYPDKHELIVEYCDNSRPAESGAAALLKSLGFYRDKIQTMRLDLR
ncbi:MAG: DEAD/DEAH box helicase [Bacteroidota bacterium]|nr:DEAD/DEAH box helicase [Bacteroidota bacterium]